MFAAVAAYMVECDQSNKLVHLDQPQPLAHSHRKKGMSKVVMATQTGHSPPPLSECEISFNLDFILYKERRSDLHAHLGPRFYRIVPLNPITPWTARLPCSWDEFRSLVMSRLPDKPRIPEIIDFAERNGELIWYGRFEHGIPQHQICEHDGFRFCNYANLLSTKVEPESNSLNATIFLNNLSNSSEEAQEVSGP